MEGTHKNFVQAYREAGVRLVYEVMEEGAFANLLLNRFLKSSAVAVPERRLLTEIVNGTIRMVKHLDGVLNLFLTKAVHKQNPWLRNILRVSAYQLLFMDRLAVYACVNEAVELGRFFCGEKLSGVINGVLRNLIRHKDNITLTAATVPEYLSVYYSHPLWIVNWMLDLWPEEQVRQILIYNNQAPSVTVRNCSLRNSRAELREMLRMEGVETEESPAHPRALKLKPLPFSLENSRAFQEGRFYIQNPASMLAADILAPQPGEHIYDLCCGVGGKTTNLAEYMDNEGRITAVDLYDNKLSLLRRNCDRMNIGVVETVCGDLQKGLGSYLPGDRVILDAPCSGLGVLNRRADARWRIEPGTIKELSELQRQLLVQAASLVKPRGVLLYCTCTVHPEENETQIENFLRSRGDFQLEDFCERIPRIYNERADAQKGMLKIIPGRLDTDGMFYALMRRV
ncbi:MAG: 16S rRNA (cytosine(967)-C(5))-methyltransferase RsmB [Syntrophomonadaceae bacterium]|jgi:16S rRNA (cytosine967-C5)-methyltransferase|nr:16S rRNA (cytosine(967)-C(5))-methyltransferase RsmB [Syntrophomonadaceae bacterium]